MNNLMLALGIVIVILLYACASLLSSEYDKLEAKWELDHACHSVDGRMYKCEEPTPTFWMKRK